ncbi:uncharacterized protein H6S33_009971 [Morchella sextelata]|uniref:uncharacterized protein n=1 Tax=Morchella sextelata TaxID=1174677 RepID=UPI001D039344|nr:uncharacterized protein H6S33_009971 [Morchella sextelata]KAH0611919.1 hypothetical protein H6S33_009971 [Morchella sextelata]
MNIEREKENNNQKPQTTEKNCMSNKEKIDYEPKKKGNTTVEIFPLYIHTSKTPRIRATANREREHPLSIVLCSVREPIQSFPKFEPPALREGQAFRLCRTTPAFMGLEKSQELTGVCFSLTWSVAAKMGDIPQGRQKVCLQKVFGLYWYVEVVTKQGKETSRSTLSGQLSALAKQVFGLSYTPICMCTQSTELGLARCIRHLRRQARNTSVERSNTIHLG